jgi:hydrogenase maturation factor HypE
MKAMTRQQAESAHGVLRKAPNILVQAIEWGALLRITEFPFLAKSFATFRVRIAM